jgi:hypothetical protein
LSVDHAQPPAEFKAECTTGPAGVTPRTRPNTTQVNAPPARARGADCDRIPPSLPGVGYVVVEGVREPVRVRAAYVSDDELRAMAAAYPAPEPNDLIRLADMDGAA